MIDIDIFSGFLGAGKTTLIKKLIREVYAGEKVVLIENEFGEIGVDGGFLKDAGIEITEMNSGCICCSLVGDFAKALKEVAEKFSPDRIVIEPSGVGKLSDVIRAVERANVPNSRLHAFCTVVDAKKCKSYLKNFGEFFLDQVENASCIVLSHTAGEAAKTQEAADILKEHTNATIITTDWDKLSGKEIFEAASGEDTLKAELHRLKEEAEHEHHHHHDHDEDGECCCGHHHHDHDHEHEHEHEHHHHDHDEHGHEHHHHHHADEVFTSWGKETSKVYTEEEIKATLSKLDSGAYGQILRAKGIVDGKDKWIYFDFVPGEIDIRAGAPAVTGRLCVIGCKLDTDKIEELF
ncbi:MAG: GTP-binding protein [Clostridia bacterium]|nr:GTP-binding protein [Clostridia bacterium]